MTDQGAERGDVDGLARRAGRRLLAAGRWGYDVLRGLFVGRHLDDRYD